MTLPRNSIKTLIKCQKLTKNDILPLFNILGYQLPPNTRKEGLLDALEDHLNFTKSKFVKYHQVLALDMGLKNMSLARLKLDNKEKLPTLSQWFKINLDPLDCNFNPINYANITTKFIYEQILNNRLSSIPIDLLMERQRFRTGGASSVLESTLKTNTIEAMLCMGLTMNNYLNENPNLKINISSSAPGAMVKYWQNLYYKDEKISEKESKSFRIELISNMLLSTLKTYELTPKHVKEYSNMNEYVKISNIKPYFVLSQDLINGLTKLLKDKKNESRWESAWGFKAHSRRLWEIVKILNEANTKNFKIDDELWATKKGDDLADSLLHGLTHYEYLKNRDAIRKVIEKSQDVKEFVLTKGI
ncbi:hypothetical protein C6P40_003229 [Pichia californica]|uniref:Mitochondrial resolvase Ydc2 catalytic domain-containing protein n=1 Tax=Pichia californica TaxID=460514 RepID=A0A9P7BHC0_9ASCO|nr:hypothetical protein C6P42_004289 [[Candida] californica]KAG0690305.1 hypothetical protein C6P40_003229 [[Candida] californica]